LHFFFSFRGLIKNIDQIFFCLQRIELESKHARVCMDMSQSLRLNHLIVDNDDPEVGYSGQVHQVYIASKRLQPLGL
jgi:hypothetical protein